MGGYDATGAMVGIAHTLGDGGSFYLSEVYVLPAHRGAGLGRAIVRAMIDDGPAWETRPRPSAETATLLLRALFFTRKVPLTGGRQDLRKA
jgi:GNAT superfamily N-acetyltransferase